MRNDQRDSARRETLAGLVAVEGHIDHQLVRGGRRPRGIECIERKVVEDQQVDREQFPKFGFNSCYPDARPSAS
jgi:hypothetical protein